MRSQDTTPQPNAQPKTDFAAVEQAMFDWSQDWIKAHHRYLAAGDGERDDCHHVLPRKNVTLCPDTGRESSLGMM